MSQLSVVNGLTPPCHIPSSGSVAVADWLGDIFFSTALHSSTSLLISHNPILIGNVHPIFARIHISQNVANEAKLSSPAFADSCAGATDFANKWFYFFRFDGFQAMFAEYKEGFPYSAPNFHDKLS